MLLSLLFFKAHQHKAAFIIIINAWILTLKTSNDAVLRKEVPYGGYKSGITYLTEFYGKFGKITIVSVSYTHLTLPTKRIV